METPQQTPHSAIDAYSPRVFVALVYWLAYLRRPASGGE
jgi:hypothetical protein